MRPYFVELTMTAVVMANNEADAEFAAIRYSRDILSDCGEPDASGAVEVRSLEQLKKLDHLWNGECCPYNDKDGRRLREIVPAEEPFRDTKTVDMFAS